MIHLDTHVVAWLYAGHLERIPNAVRQRLSAEALAISPMVGLELRYLHEIGRITRTDREVLDDLRLRIGLEQSDTPFEAVVAAATDLSWARDPFDRLIAGQAIAAGAVLVTADRTIRAHLDSAVWAD